jgi:glycosyltransferase involved in cell wall biosynthesis
MAARPSDEWSGQPAASPNGARRPLRVAAFTGGVTVPNARFRVRQYVPALRAAGVEMAELPARLGTYPPLNKAIRPLWALGTLAARLPDVLASHRYDVTFLQRELLSTFETLERFTRAPRVFDVDDAVFAMRGGGRFAAGLARRCDLVICGNDYLAEWFAAHARRLTVIPTAVDTHRFTPPARPAARAVKVIGWIGSSVNYHYLYGIERALCRVLEGEPRAVLRVMAERPPAFRMLPPDRYEYVPWSAEAEVACLQSMDIGIMPLDEAPVAKGKCSYKMLQYMACARPVVVSPVSMNAQVLALGEVGRAARTEDEWVEALGGLLRDEASWPRLGRAGRAVVEAHFSIEAVAPRLAAALASLAG